MELIKTAKLVLMAGIVGAGITLGSAALGSPAYASTLSGVPVASSYIENKGEAALDIAVERDGRIFLAHEEGRNLRTLSKAKEEVYGNEVSSTPMEFYGDVDNRQVMNLEQIVGQGVLINTDYGDNADPKLHQALRIPSYQKADIDDILYYSNMVVLVEGKAVENMYSLKDNRMVWNLFLQDNSSDKPLLCYEDGDNWKILSQYATMADAAKKKGSNVQALGVYDGVSDVLNLIAVNFGNENWLDTNIGDRSNNRIVIVEPSRKVIIEKYPEVLIRYEYGLSGIFEPVLVEHYYVGYPYHIIPSASHIRANLSLWLGFHLGWMNFALGVNRPYPYWNSVWVNHDMYYSNHWWFHQHQRPGLRPHHPNHPQYYPRGFNAPKEKPKMVRDHEKRKKGDGQRKDRHDTQRGSNESRFDRGLRGARDAQHPIRDLETEVRAPPRRIYTPPTDTRRDKSYLRGGKYDPQREAIQGIREAMDHRVPERTDRAGPQQEYQRRGRDVENPYMRRDANEPVYVRPHQKYNHREQQPGPEFNQSRPDHQTRTPGNNRDFDPQYLHRGKPDVSADEQQRPQHKGFVQTAKEAINRAHERAGRPEPQQRPTQEERIQRVREAMHTPQQQLIQRIQEAMHHRAPERGQDPQQGQTQEQKEERHRRHKEKSD